LASPLIVQPSAKDTFIRSDNPTTNYGTDILLKTYDRDTLTIRPLLEFDISGLPADQTLLSATLELYYVEISGTDPVGKTIWAYKQSHPDWVEAEATYNIYKTGSNWTNPGGDYVTSDPAGGSTTFPADYGWMSWDILDICQDAYDSSIAVEILLRFETEGLSSEYSGGYFYSNNYSTAYYRPKLTIEYESEEEPGWAGEFGGVLVDATDGFDGVAIDELDGV